MIRIFDRNHSAKEAKIEINGVFYITNKDICDHIIDSEFVINFQEKEVEALESALEISKKALNKYACSEYNEQNPAYIMGRTARIALKKINEILEKK